MVALRWAGEVRRFQPVPEDAVPLTYENLTITFPNGGVASFKAIMRHTTVGSFRVKMKPGTYMFTPGPWYRRLAYWFRLRVRK